MYLVADSLAQAKEDLRRDWGTDRRLGWAIDTGTPVSEPLAAEASRRVPRARRDALRRGRLVAERQAILAVVPPNPTAAIRAEAERARLQQDREDLAAGTGRYRDHPVASALRELQQAEGSIARLERNLPAGAAPGTSGGRGERSWPSRERDSSARRGGSPI